MLRKTSAFQCLPYIAGFRRPRDLRQCVISIVVHKRVRAPVAIPLFVCSFSLHVGRGSLQHRSPINLIRLDLPKALLRPPISERIVRSTFTRCTILASRARS